MDVRIATTFEPDTSTQVLRNGLVGSATERSLSDRKTALWDNPMCQLCAGIPVNMGDGDRTVS